MAKEDRPNTYLEEGKLASQLVFPDDRDQNVHDVEWMVLEQNKRDPVCLVDLTVMHMSDEGKTRGGLSFSAITARYVHLSHPCL